jgi:hypothetical protein
MRKVYYFVNASGDSVFGAITQSHGQLPAFFTDESHASRFGAFFIPEDKRASTVFGSTDREDELRAFLTFNEKSYVILNGVPMTAVDMKSELSAG